MSKGGATLWGETTTLVAHNDNTTVFYVGGVDILASKKGAVDRHSFSFSRAKKVDKVIYIVYTDTKNSAHSSLHDLWIIAIGTLLRAYYILYAKPIGKADDSTEISRVLHAIEG